MSVLAIKGGNPLIKKNFNLGAVYHSEEYKAVSEVLDSGLISGFLANNSERFWGGKKVRQLEDLFKDFFDVPFAVASNSATSSLHSAVVSLGIEPGDEVIVPSLSMSASAACIVMAGATPVFADIKRGRCENCNCQVSDLKNRGCFNINPDDLQELITDKTKAILVVHLFGKAADMDTLMDIAYEYDLKVIEDCAQSPGTEYNGVKVGTIGDVGVFSFNQSKMISAGEGGVTITKNKEAALRLQLMRNHAEAVIDNLPEGGISGLIGYNYRMTDLEAAIAIEQFKRLSESFDRRTVLANTLTKKLRNHGGLITLGLMEEGENALFLYPVLYDPDYYELSRDVFVRALQAEGVPFNCGYTTPLTRLKTFNCFLNENIKFDSTNYLNESSLITTKICHHENITKDDINLIIKAVGKVISNLDQLR